MRQDPFPSAGDGEEPDGSVPPAAMQNGPDEEEGIAQGLYVCLPSENLDVARFAQHGESDAMPPGPMLASVVHALTGETGEGLAALSDDQLVGVIAATRRLESRIAWTQLAAMAEFAARRPAEPGGRGRGRSAQPCEFAADELAGELHLTWQSAAGQVAYAQAVADRLPRTFAGLAAGTIHPVHVRIIADETSILSAADAARADAELAGAAGSMTFGRLRSHAHRLILKLDPEAARKRKETARQDAHVRRFPEDSGNAGMVARELPPDEVLASWQHVEQRALDLRAVGVPGTLQELRVRAYLDLLQERDARTALTPDGGPAAGSAHAAPDASPQDAGGPGAPPDGTTDTTGPGDPGGPGGNSGPGGPGGNGGPGPQPGRPAGTGPGGRAAPDPGPAVAALVNLTVPLATVTGHGETPGEATGYGILDPDAARDLAAAAARHPRTRWCLTALAPDGTAAAHACLPGPLPWHAGPQAAAALRARTPAPTRALTWTPVIRGPCDHAHAERRYRPGRLLQHLVRARNTRCTAPGCGQPAARCDLDHTVPWDQGGRTCECGLAPLCRHHHRCKQAQGWRLEQPEPGVLVWHTPSGRSYATTPTVYPV
jgi:Domain of unknown function (DUF222)